MGEPQAMTVDTTLSDFLVRERMLKPEQIQQLLVQSRAAGRPFEEVIEQSRLVSEEDLTAARAKLFNVPFIDLIGQEVSRDLLALIPVELAKNYRMIAYARERDVVSVAMVDPGNFKALEALEFLGRKNRIKLAYAIATPSGFKYVLRQYDNLTREVEEALARTTPDERLEVGKIDIVEEGFEEIVKTAPVSKMVSVILRHAVEGKASDVHIEPMGNETRVRYRIDGILHTSLVLPRNVHAALIARVKVMSNLKIDETRVPQDGRFHTTIEGHDIDYRVSTLPLISNEKVVMRILDTTTTVLDLGALGFEGATRLAMEEGIRKSHGMFLMTGPTGSGKTTTLYGLLDILNEEGVNIVTLEDPVEYFMQGINQSQINPDIGMTFASGLRSILRQDPDIIMVGEVRDTETAGLAVHAALTGHVVLSTLHTNDAFGAIPRLMDMKIEPFLIASSLNIVMAQRLVRRICQSCRIEDTLKPIIEQEVAQEIEGLSKNALEKNPPPKDVKLTKPFKMFRGQGCVRCEMSGYKGRLAIAEVLVMTPELQDILTSRPANMIEAIKAEFRRQGMFSMRQDGVFKALNGLTTIDEVWDVTRS